jgi:beta-lactamase regulating signal transducer with metallopeptidase domain
MAGMAILFGRVAVELRRVHVLRRATRHAPRLAGDVDVRSSDLVSVPMALGWRQPLVLVPAHALSLLSAAELRAILAHELAHVRRRDYAVNLFVVMVESVFFFHPAARWIASRVRAEREFCCDDAAVAAAGDPVTYARGLAALEDTRSNYRLAVAASSGTLFDRINRIVKNAKPSLTPARGAVALTAASFVAAVIVSLSMAVPPQLPWGAVIKRRMPAPPGVSIGPERLNGVDAGGAPRWKVSGQERDTR